MELLVPGYPFRPSKELSKTVPMAFWWRRQLSLFLIEKSCSENEQKKVEAHRFATADNETMFSRWFLKLESRAFQNGYSDVRSMDGWRAMRARSRAIQIKNFHFTFLLICCMNELVPVACLIVGSSI